MNKPNIKYGVIGADAFQASKPLAGVKRAAHSYAEQSSAAPQTNSPSKKTDNKLNEIPKKPPTKSFETESETIQSKKHQDRKWFGGKKDYAVVHAPMERSFRTNRAG